MAAVPDIVPDQVLAIPVRRRVRAVQPRRMSESTWGYFLILPAVLLVLGLILYPVVYSGWLSLHNKHAYLPIETFIGFQNFAAMFKDGEFWRSIQLGAIYGIGSVGLQILIGVSAALLLNETFIGRTFIRGVALFPYMVPTVVVVILMKWILNDAYGVLPYIFKTIGIGEDILWLDTGHVMLTVILISTWTFFPFVVIGTLARLQTIDPELYAAAKVDGAGVVRRFIHVTLPQLRNVLFVVILLRFMFLLPENAAVQLAAAEREEAEAATAVAALGEEGERGQAELATLRPAEHLLARADEIRAFRDRGIEIRAAKSELPRQEAELEAARNELRRLGSDLGWKGADTHAIVTRIPPQAKVGAVRALLSRRAEIDAEVRATTRIVRECEEQRERLEKRVAGAAAPVDVARLGAAIGSVRERGDLLGQVQVAESRVADLRARVERQLGSLQPEVTDEKVLGQIPVPTREQVQNHRDLDRECRERYAEATSRLQSLRRELDSTNAVLDRLVNDEVAVSAESLDRARGRRAALWSLVKRRYVELRRGVHVRFLRF